MMARLLEAVRPQARLILVGDPDQLASVEAGAVLGDLAGAVGPPEPTLDAALRALELPDGVRHGVVTLDRVWRFGGAIAEFARAVQAGDVDAATALLDARPADLELVGPGELDPIRRDVVDAATALTTDQGAGTYIPQSIPLPNYLQELVLGGDAKTFVQKLDKDWRRLAQRTA